MQYYAHDSLGRQARKTFDDRLARAIILVTSRYLFLSKKRDTCKACKVLHSPIVLLKTWLQSCRVHRGNRNFIQYWIRIIFFYETSSQKFGLKVIWNVSFSRILDFLIWIQSPTILISPISNYFTITEQRETLHIDINEELNDLETSRDRWKREGRSMIGRKREAKTWRQ